jgi:hypothetical protein
MRLAWLVVLGVMAAAPVCAQNRHNYDAIENRRLDEIEQQRADNIRLARPRPKPKAPTEAEKKAIAWRADHLTCADPKGRTAAQYAAECKPAAANP